MDELVKSLTPVKVQTITRNDMQELEVKGPEGLLSFDAGSIEKKTPK